MSTPGLVGRRTQREVLALACDERRQAHVVAARGEKPRAAEIRTRFLALAENELLLRLPRPKGSSLASPGVLVDVHFEHEQEYLTFRCASLGSGTWSPAGRRPVAAWRLAMPVRLDPCRQRWHCRSALPPAPPIVARFTAVDETGCTFDAALRNLSAGGLGVELPRSSSCAARPGRLYRVTFELPDESGPLAFIVRVVHVQRDAGGVARRIGCTYGASDDPSLRDAQLDRIEQFIRRQATADARRDAVTTK